MPSYCTGDVLNIGKNSNVGVSGKWVFKIDSSEIESTEFDNTGKFLTPLVMNPSFVDAFGHVPFELKGPCINETANVTFRFHDPAKRSVDTTGFTYPTRQ